MLSIIIINYNSTSHTKKCLKSLQQQTYKNFEIILVDNNSTEIFREDLLRFLNRNELDVDFKKKIRFIQSNKKNYLLNEDNIGFTGGNNLGIKISKGEIILLLNNDTIHENDFLELMINFIEDNPDIDIAQPCICYYNNHNLIWGTGGKINKFSFRLFSHLNYLDNYSILNLKKAIIIDYAIGCALFTRRNILRKIGLLDNNYFLYCEEVDLCYRANLHGYSHFLCNPKAKIFHDLPLEYSNPYKKYYYRNRIIFCFKFFSVIIIAWQILMSIVSILIITTNLRTKRIDYMFFLKSLRGILTGIKTGSIIRIRRKIA